MGDQDEADGRAVPGADFHQVAGLDRLQHNGFRHMVVQGVFGQQTGWREHLACRKVYFDQTFNVLRQGRGNDMV